MNIQDNLFEKLEALGFSCYFHNASLDCYYGKNHRNNEIQLSNCTHFSITELGKFNFVTGKLPKQKQVDTVYLIERYNKRQESKFVNYVGLFKRIINSNGFWVYPTSYGIGIDNLFNRNRDTEIKKLSDFLTKHGIDFRNEYSDAFWVYRFRISQSQENINRLKMLTESI